MKKLKATLILLIMIISFSSVLFDIEAETVVTTDEANPISTNVQENSFIWNNRVYVFYCNEAYMVYKSRTNFTDWGSEISIRVATDGSHFSIWLEEDGINGYVHYAYAESGAGNELMYYRKGQLLSDGSISWYAGEQTIEWSPMGFGVYAYLPYIATDSEGYPIIVGATYKPPNGGGSYYRTWLRRSSTKDGTWNTDLEYSWYADPGWDQAQYAWTVNKIIPIQSRKFHVISFRVDCTNRDYYYDGDGWSIVDDPLGAVYSSNTNQYQWDAVAENGNDVIHAVYNRYFEGYHFFQHKKWNSSGWFYVSPEYEGVDAYEWDDLVVPQLSLNSSDNTMRATWLEYNGTSFLNNTVWYRDWNGTGWGTPTVWFTETDDIYQHEDFTSIYSSSYYNSICYLTNASSSNVECYYEPPLLQPSGEEYYDVLIQIRVNGYEPYTNLTFLIDGSTYADGQTVNLYSDIYGDNHSLDGTPVTHLTFLNWTVEGSLTVTDSNNPTTFLYVSGTGTLTQHLNATVDITHDSTTITNMNVDTWVFAEYRFYAFQSQYIMTNSYIDTVQWSFLDFATHNITFYFNNATTEAVLYGSDYISLRNNASYSYNWLNLTDQTFTVTIWVWVKINIIDTLYVDLYVQGNCSGYGMTNSTGGWVTAQSEYFNIYSQGGAEELTIGVVTGGMLEDSSVAAGRSEGGDIFNLYAYNDTFALSEQYWRKLVHVKVLFEFKWDHAADSGLPWSPPSSDFPTDLHYQLGWTYYARGNWSENRFSRIDLKLEGFGYGAGHQFSQWSIKIVHGGVQVYSDTLIGWFDNQAKSYKVWLDLWFNSANASSLAGARATSYWYGVYNEADWWARVFTGNSWGVLNENETSHLAFGMLRDEDVYEDRIFSSEIELVKLWCRMYQSNTVYNYSASIWKIEIFDKVFNEKSMGIATPAFEAPHMPSMPMGGFLGVIYSALMWLAEMTGPGLMQFWYLFVGFLDGTIGNWLGQPTFFSWFFEQIALFFDYMVNSVSYYLSILGGFFIFLGATIGKFAGLVGQAFQTWSDMFTMFFSILDTGLDSGINIWNDLGLSTWLILGLILYPIFLLTIWEEDGLEALMAHIMFIINILAFLLNLLLRVAQFGINIIHYLIESIPVVE